MKIKDYDFRSRDIDVEIKIKGFRIREIKKIKMNGEIGAYYWN